MDQNSRQNRHLILEGFTETEPFRSVSGGGTPKNTPERNRAEHGAALLGQIGELKLELAAAKQAQEEAGLESGFGLKVEFESFPDVPLAFESLARERQGIELLNVRQEGQRTNATVLVPDGKLEHFEKLVRDYLPDSAMPSISSSFSSTPRTRCGERLSTVNGPATRTFLLSV